MGTDGARRHRRVRRPGAPGTDPAPERGIEEALRAGGDPEAARGERGGGNDERLLRDVPPHWGKR